MKASFTELMVPSLITASAQRFSTSTETDSIGTSLLVLALLKR
jgi:hypothetical protein